jgi:hypothetical protein
MNQPEQDTGAGGFRRRKAILEELPAGAMPIRLNDRSNRISAAAAAG